MCQLLTHTAVYTRFIGPVDRVYQVTGTFYLFIKNTPLSVVEILQNYSHRPQQNFAQDWRLPFKSNAINLGV